MTGYGDGGDEPEKPLELLPGAIERARVALADRPETRERFDRVGLLVVGFESSFGLELLSTVHWVLAREGVASDEELVTKAYAWGERKRRFSEQQVLLARDVLAKRGFVSSSPS